MFELEGGVVARDDLFMACSARHRNAICPGGPASHRGHLKTIITCCVACYKQAEASPVKRERCMKSLQAPTLHPTGGVMLGPAACICLHAYAYDDGIKAIRTTERGWRLINN